MTTHSFGQDNQATPVAAPVVKPAAEVRSRSNLGRTFVRGGAEEKPSQFAKAFLKHIEAAGGEAAEYRVVQVPTSDGVRLPIVALARKIKGNIYCYGYLLWHGQIIPPYVDPQTQESIPRTANDVCDAITANKMAERVKREFIGSSGANVIVAGLQPISAEVTHENEEQVGELIFVAGNAIETSAEHAGDLEVDTVTMNTLRSSAGRLEAVVTYGNENAVSLNGLPYRSDIHISMVQTVGKQNPNSLHNTTETLTELSGYIDFAYAPAEQVAAEIQRAHNAVMYPGVHSAAKPNRRFIPTFVITNTDYLLGGVNLQSKLFAIGASLPALLRQPYQWVETYRNNYGRDNPLRNLGGLAREVPTMTDSKANANTQPPGKSIDALATSFKRQDLWSLAEELVFPDIVIAYDVDEGGPWAWLESVFIDAAGVNNPTPADTERSERAKRLIFAALNQLTADRFSQNFKPGGRIFLPTSFRMHRGYFNLDARGRMDTRELGTLELLNSDTGKTSYENAIKYAQTFEDPNTPEHVKQKLRHEVYRDTLGGGDGLVKVMGHTRRLFFSSEFVQALLASFQQAGLSFTAEQLHVGTGTVQRGAQYLNGGIVASNLGLGFVANNQQVGGQTIGYAAPVAQSIWNN